MFNSPLALTNRHRSSLFHKMNSPPRHAGIPVQSYIEDFWTTQANTWPATTTDRESPRSNTHTRAYSEGYDSVDHSTPARGVNAVCVPTAGHQDTKPIPDDLAISTRPEADQRQGLKEHLRGDIELQLATINKYIHNKKLKAIEWICCSCSKEQKYRENLEPLDRLRCQYPRCGVSDKGFRIYRVHNMCDHCTVFVDQRAPLTKKTLKKKRDEVREVLRKIKKVYEDVDCLAEFDDKEAAEMATLFKEREAREELDRERREEQDLAQVEMKRQQGEEWVDDDWDHSDTVSQYEDFEQATEQEDWKTDEEARKQRPRRENKVYKKRGFKALLGL